MLWRLWPGAFPFENDVVLVWIKTFDTVIAFLNYFRKKSAEDNKCIQITEYTKSERQMVVEALNCWLCPKLQSGYYAVQKA